MKDKIFTTMKNKKDKCGKMKGKKQQDKIDKNGIIDGKKKQNGKNKIYIKVTR